MTEGEVPLGWKTANISQIFKKEAETLRGITDHLALPVSYPKLWSQ